MWYIVKAPNQGYWKIWNTAERGEVPEDAERHGPTHDAMAAIMAAEIWNESERQRGEGDDEAAI